MKRGVWKKLSKVVSTVEKETQTRLVQSRIHPSEIKRTKERCPITKDGRISPLSKTYLLEDGVDEVEDGLDAGVDSDVVAGAAFEQELVVLGVVTAEFEASRLLLGGQDLEEVEEGRELRMAIGKRLGEGRVLAGDLDIQAWIWKGVYDSS